VVVFEWIGLLTPGAGLGVKPGLEIEVELWLTVSNKDEVFSYPGT